LKTINELKAEQAKAELSYQLLAALEKINVDTQIEKKRRINVLILKMKIPVI
jgi:hypothetical protein